MASTVAVQIGNFYREGIIAEKFGAIHDDRTFAVTGLGTSTYAITLPSTITLTGTPSGTMTVGTFVSTPSGTGALTAGAQTLLVGGTLNVAAAQAAGVYTNTTDMTVTVNYN